MSVQGDPLSLAELQQRVDRWIDAAGGYHDPLTNLGRLSEETGELARILIRTDGQIRVKSSDDVSAGALKRELGDLLFTIICLANQKKVNLADALLATLERYDRRNASGDDPSA